MCGRDERGAALFIALIVTMILMVLSTVFVFAMSTEVKQAAAHNHRVEAYYFARSGVDVARGWLRSKKFEIEAGETYNLSGDLTTGFEENQVAGAPIAVTIVKFTAAGDERIEIRATGRYREEEELVILIMRRLDLSLFDDREWEDGQQWEEGEDFFHSGNDELEPRAWTEEAGNDNRISDTEGDLWESELPVQFKAGAANPVILPNEDTAHFQTPEIHFESRLDLKNDAALHLSVVLAAFHEDVDLKSDAVLRLSLYGGHHTGYVYFAEGVQVHGHPDILPGLYSFTGSISLPADFDRLKFLSPPEDVGWFEDLWQ